MACAATGGDKELRVMLVGKTGVGKSALGNALLGGKQFISTPCAQGVTQRSEFKTNRKCLKNDYELIIIDTPGVFDTETSNPQILKEILRGVTLVEPGPHVIIFVLAVGRVTTEEQDALELLKNAFGDEISGHLFVIFTHGDSLKRERLSIVDFVKNSPARLQDILTTCSDRYDVIDTQSKYTKKEAAKIRLMIWNFAHKNHFTCYTNDMFKIATEIREESLMTQAEHRTEVQDGDDWYQSTLSKVVSAGGFVLGLYKTLFS